MFPIIGHRSGAQTLVRLRQIDFFRFLFTRSITIYIFIKDHRGFAVDKIRLDEPLKRKSNVYRL